MADLDERRIGAYELRVLDELAEIKSLVKRSHRTEMQKIDEETTALGLQIEEISSGQVSEEQIVRLRAVATRLKAIGNVASNPEP